MTANVTIFGNIGKSPELKALKTGKPVCTFSVAVDDGYGDQKDTTWYSVSVFGKSAETAAKLLTKGSTVYVAGSQSMKRFTGKDGQPKQVINVAAHSWKLAGGKRDATPGDDIPTFDEDLPF